MSRSYRHTPIAGITTCRSEKEWKQRWHRRLRSAVRRTLLQTMDDALLPHFREVSNIWTFGKDGKQYFGHLANPPEGEEMITRAQRCVDLYNKFMRK